MNKNGWQDAPTVRAGFMVPPVKGPSAKMPAATESPIASGAAFCKEEFSGTVMPYTRSIRSAVERKRHT